MARIQMQQARHIKSCDIFRPRSDAIPAIFAGGSFTGCDLEGVVFDKRLELAGCNFSGTQLRALPMCCMCCCLLPRRHFIAAVIAMTHVQAAACLTVICQLLAAATSILVAAHSDGQTAVVTPMLLRDLLRKFKIAT